MIRWLVVETGNWLSGRQVLLSPSALGHAEPEFPARLTKAEVEASLTLASDRPVSRQFETSTYDYYRWSRPSCMDHRAFRVHRKRLQFTLTQAIS
jgi:hypothetical protein